LFHSRRSHFGGNLWRCGRGLGLHCFAPIGHRIRGGMLCNGWSFCFRMRGRRSLRLLRGCILVRLLHALRLCRGYGGDRIRNSDLWSRFWS